LVATFWRVRSGLPLPSISVGVALLTVGVLAGVAMSAGVVTVPGTGPGPAEGVGEEPEVAQLGGDQPPMEFTPVPSAVKVAPSAGQGVGSRVVVTPPPHSNPVVTPEVVEPRESVVGTTVVPSVSLPAVSSEPLPSVGSSAVEEPGG
jgi:hypothetical protein